MSTLGNGTAVHIGSGAPLARALALAFAVLLAAGCAVGPNYKRPVVVTAASYKEVDGWKPSEPADVMSRGPWWQIFNDDVLNQLESQVNVSNENVKAAAQAVDEARALVREGEASFWPSISLSASRQRTVEGLGAFSTGLPTGGGASSGTAITTTENTVGASGSWDLDIWGKTRRTVEGEKASAQASAAALATTELTAQADLASDYFELRAQDQLEFLLVDIVEADDKALKITQARYRDGVAYKADILSAQTELLTAQAQQVNTQIQRATLEHAIAVLIGKQPAELALKPAMLASVIPTVPPGVPSTLLERRPDIAQAEREVASANAQVGVAISAFFPSLTLAASDEYSGLTLSKLIRASNQIWSFGPSIAQTLFEGGLIRAQVAQARASYRESVANYRQTVLADFEQVEDQLVTLRVLEKQAVLEDQLVKASREDETLTLEQYKAGTEPYSSVITAQTTRLNAEETALTVQLDRFTSSISLIEALGGGWNTSQLK
ncbi:MAG: efflux transporter outer membrane subunit [Steroidobacteraceae bacterium]